MRTRLLKLMFRVFAALPLPVAHAVGAFLGWFFLIIPNKRRRTAKINIDLCFPEMSRGARQRLLKRNMIEMGKSVTEIGVLWTRGEKNLRRLVRRISGEDHLKKAMDRGKGLILAIPHLGTWEMVGLWGSLKYPMTTLYRAPPMTQMGRLMRKARERFGARLESADSRGIRALYKALERGELVAILPDQVPSARSGSVFAPFFGIPASTMVLLSRLAIKTGAPSGCPVGAAITCIFCPRRRTSVMATSYPPRPRSTPWWKNACVPRRSSISGYTNASATGRAMKRLSIEPS
jgi:KDO2-lipid IV(A) lauroyltransferase